MSIRKRRHIAYVTGTRADYGLVRNTLAAVALHPRLKLSVLATGMHLMPEFGATIREVERDGFDLHKIPATYRKDDQASVPEFLGTFILGLTHLLRTLRPDFLLLLGDRAEMLGAASVGLYLGIPIAHVHGGEVTSTVDEPVRHSISKLANLHFPATLRSARRLLRMGERAEHVHRVGAPGLDGIHDGLLDTEALDELFRVDCSRPFAIVLQHPVSLDHQRSGYQMRQTLLAIKALGIPALVIYPNADPGARMLIQIIERFRGSLIRAFKNIRHVEFLSLLKHASVLVGNSSAGIIEAASFKLPVVNIGPRQAGRERSGNVLDVEHDTKQITAAIRKALQDAAFRQHVRSCRNVYGDGKTGPRIARVLSEIAIDDHLLQKHLTY